MTFLERIPPVIREHKQEAMTVATKSPCEVSGDATEPRLFHRVFRLACVLFMAIVLGEGVIQVAYAADTKDTVYKPGEVPNFGENYQGPSGEDYDAREDPNHPLKDATKDPGEEWEGSHEAGAKFGTMVKKGKADWPWGERYYDGRFAAPLVIENECKSPQPVGIFVSGLPYLTMPSLVMVPAEKKITVLGQVQLPPEPPPPPTRIVGPTEIASGLSSWGYIPFYPEGYVLPPGETALHQPNFEKIEATVVVWHPWAPADDCPAVRKTYTVSGHIHFRPPPPDGDRGPERFSETDVCQFYWLIGEPPVHIGDKDCTGEMRELAVNFREKILNHYILNAPEEWRWFPGNGAIRQMSIPELLAMKAHAEAVTGVGPGAAAAVAWQPHPGEPTTQTVGLEGAVPGVEAQAVISVSPLNTDQMVGPTPTGEQPSGGKVPTAGSSFGATPVDRVGQEVEVPFLDDSSGTGSVRNNEVGIPSAASGKTVAPRDAGASESPMPGGTPAGISVSPLNTETGVKRKK